MTGVQDIVNRHKAEHVLHKGERGRQKGRHTCAHAKSEKQKEAKMVVRDHRSLGVGVARPLKGPEVKRNRRHHQVTFFSLTRFSQG